VKINLSGYSCQEKQAQLHNSRANEIVYGGAAGPGKSHALRFEGLKWGLSIPKLQVYLFRRTFPELEDNHVLPSLDQFPAKVGQYSQIKHRWHLVTDSYFHFCHCKNEKDVFRYQGAEMHLLLIDELTTFTEFIYDYLRSRVRCTLDIPKEFRHKIPGIVCATNPGGIGHEFVKRRWVKFAKPMQIKRAPKREGGMRRQYIPGLLKDNPILMKKDPEYIHRLDGLPEPYRTAYKKGDWDIFMGQMFAFNRKDHVIKPIPVPRQAPLYTTFDWGFGKPYSVGWWWVDADGRLYRFAELYGAVPGQVNTGVRQTDDEIAEAIIAKEIEENLEGREITRLADPTCFNKKPDYRGGGQGPSTAEVFAKHNLFMAPADADRKLKIRQFHQRLRVKTKRWREPPDAPMMLIYESCEAFISTIPNLQADEHRPEDVDTDMEDHVYDEAAQICMARSLTARGQTVTRSGDSISKAGRKGALFTG